MKNNLKLIYVLSFLALLAKIMEYIVRVKVLSVDVNTVSDPMVYIYLYMATLIVLAMLMLADIVAIIFYIICRRKERNLYGKSRK